MFTKAEIVDLAINQLADDEFEEAVVAFNGFEDQFGRTWIERYFKGAKILSFVRGIVEMWADYSPARK